MTDDKEENIEMKICIGPCGAKLSIDCFGKKQSRCRPCQSLCGKEYYQNNKEERKKYSRTYYQENKEEVKEQRKEYQENNKDKASVRGRKHYENNKDKIKARSKQYAADNPEKVRQYKNKSYSKNKEKIVKKNRESIQHKLKKSISNAIAVALKTNNNSKNGISCLKTLSYNMTQLKKHLEGLFEPWMTWKNYGKYNLDTWDDNGQSTWKWNIDHIKPQSDFCYTSMEDNDFKECWALSNLRPYSAKQNVIDGNRRKKD